MKMLLNILVMSGKGMESCLLVGELEKPYFRFIVFNYPFEISLVGFSSFT